MFKSKRKLVNLEDNIGADPVGNPRIMLLYGHEASMGYIRALDGKDGILEEDKEKLGCLFLHKIEKEAPKEADSFRASKMYNMDATYLLKTAIAVQYFKTIK